MCTTEIIIGIVLLVIVVILIAALFVKKKFNVEMQTIINKPKQQVFDYIKLLRNQDSYSVWARKDPNMQRDFKGVDGTAGFISSWVGNKEVGTGEQEILKITEGERIDTKLRFLKPFKTQSDAYMITETVSETQTRVRWGFDGAFPYPMNIMLLFIDMNKGVGNDFSEGLSNLKAVLEQ